MKAKMPCSKTGAKIRELREAQGLTQDDIGAMVGVSGTAVSKWELGNLPCRSNLEKLRQCLGTSYVELDLSGLAGSEQVELPIPPQPATVSPQPVTEAQPSPQPVMAAEPVTQPQEALPADVQVIINEIVLLPCDARSALVDLLEAAFAKEECERRLAALLRAGEKK